MSTTFHLTQAYSSRTYPDGTVVYFPALRVTFQNGRYRETIGNALIDTGADQTLLPLAMASEMGFTFDLEQDRLLWSGAGGKQFAVYQSPVPIEHILENDGFRPYSWKSHVHFTVEQPTILIGRKGFIDNFSLTVDGRSRMTEIRQ